MIDLILGAQHTSESETKIPALRELTKVKKKVHKYIFLSIYMYRQEKSNLFTTSRFNQHHN